MHILDSIQATPSLSKKLNKLGIYTWWNLALHLPLRYEDLTRVYPIAEIQAGSVAQIQGTILSHEVLSKRRKQLVVRLSDKSSIITLLFFHFFPNYTSLYAVGKTIRAYGEVKLDIHGNKTIIHPKIQAIDSATPLNNTFSPIYPSTQGLSNTQLIEQINQLFNAQIIQETLPLAILQQYKLPGLDEALLALHKLTPEQFTVNYQDYALRRLKYEELIAQQLLLHKIYIQKHSKAAPPLLSQGSHLAQTLSNLPFKLTNAQHRVLKEIFTDLKQAQQMNRLLQGDVGSGKTIVATLCAVLAVENGYQACLMAPTEILAEQHYLKISALLQKSSIKILCLNGSMRRSAKNEAIASCQSGEAQLIIGTHALIQNGVDFAKLGLVIIDEQHRFGVEQRMALVSKGTPNLFPHQLMMSATPIPRSLAMSYFADLDVSTIDELPPGRTPVTTLLINLGRRHEVINFVRENLLLGRQTYWVCPLIEESETLDLENAINTYNELSTILAPLKVGLIHGKLKTAEKAAIMAEFYAGSIQLLVATTVIEVGVDVANATLMVIEHSERMGLAQLHQLRGRVGRGAAASHCVLLYTSNPSACAKERLKAIASSTDGFKIARADLLIRGPGEILGQRQSGIPALRFAHIEHDLPLLLEAKEIAKDLANNYPDYAKYLVELWFHQQQIYAAI